MSSTSDDGTGAKGVTAKEGERGAGAKGECLSATDVLNQVYATVTASLVRIKAEPCISVRLHDPTEKLGIVKKGKTPRAIGHPGNISRNISTRILARDELKTHHELPLPNENQKDLKINIFRLVQNADFRSTSGLLLKLLYPVHFLIKQNRVSLRLVEKKSSVKISKDVRLLKTPPGTKVFVKKVTPESVAASVGVLPGQQILVINGRLLETFKSLRT